MRRAVLFLAVLMAQAFVFAAPHLPSARAQDGPIPELVLTVIAGNGSALTFSPETIRIPQVPIVLNLTVINLGTVFLHTFSIDDESTGTPRIDLQLPEFGSRGTVKFQVNGSATAPGAIGDIFHNGTAFVPDRGTLGIRFYCVPHAGQGMIGQIVLATVSEPVLEEKGIFLRAYWIGIIALGAMLLWTGLTYFVIKSSSRRFTDQREHIRRGLP